MSEDLDSMATRLKEVRTALKKVAGRPDVTMRDNLSVIRGKIGQWTHNLMNRNQASQQQSPQKVLAQQPGGPQQAQGGGRPTILGSLRGMLQQQQAPQQPQMSEEEIEYQKQEQIAYQRARDKALEEQRKLANLKKRRGLSLG